MKANIGIRPRQALTDQRAAGSSAGKYPWNRIEFGIESYFVEEGKGRDIERAIRDKKVSAEVALTVDGKAALKGLKIEP